VFRAKGFIRDFDSTSSNFTFALLAFIAHPKVRGTTSLVSSALRLAAVYTHPYYTHAADDCCGVYWPLLGARLLIFASVPPWASNITAAKTLVDPSLPCLNLV
jgi:hypothetical protein